MKDHNGFSGAQRLRALAWFKREIAQGRREAAPKACEACTQTQGVLMFHSEDYSEPFGDHIGRHGLCFRCHMMIHCRFKNPEAWADYKAHVRAGRIFHPIGRNFGQFLKETVYGRGRDVPFVQGIRRVSTFLDTLQ